MLTYDALLEQAKNRGIPSIKMRGVLREYLQILILKELYKTESGRKFYFTGGTYLRFIHGLKRFSEDLDFNINGINKEDFTNLINKIQIELKRSNINCLIKFSQWGNIYSANLVFPEIEKAYNIASKYSQKQGISIKIETKRPKWRILRETQVISGFGELFPCLCTDNSALFADKIDALAKKGKGRHLYDIIFMLSHKYPIDEKVLSSLGIREDPLVFIANTVNSFKKEGLKKETESLRPFLFEESEADLIINAKDIIPALLEKYKQEK